MSASSSLISVRVPTAVANRLEHLAKAVDRSKSYLAAEAIEDYLTLHEWQVQAIHEGLDEIKQEKTVGFSEAKQLLRKTLED